MSNALAQRIALIVRDAGGAIVGRTKLQKLVYLLTEAGLESDFVFAYKHYGPYSDGVASAARDAHLLGFMNEKDELASWGGWYSIYSTLDQRPDNVDPSRVKLAELAAAADAVELELAATALFLKREGQDNPWGETQRRKPEKCANGRLEKAKNLYASLASILPPNVFPPLT